ncbi:hypothetical protein RJG79_09005 [Mycoplasmatota bacterium WC44]
MKKISSISIALVIVLSLVACKSQTLIKFVEVEVPVPVEVPVVEYVEVEVPVEVIVEVPVEVVKEVSGPKYDPKIVQALESLGYECDVSSMYTCFYSNGNLKLYYHLNSNLIWFSHKNSTHDNLHFYISLGSLIAWGTYFYAPPENISNGDPGYSIFEYYIEQDKLIASTYHKQDIIIDTINKYNNIISERLTEYDVEIIPNMIP